MKVSALILILISGISHAEESIPWRSENKLTRIELKIEKDYKTLDETAAKKLVKDYAEEVKKIDSDFLGPALKHLEALMAERGSAASDDAKRVIDYKIAALDRNIARLSSRDVERLFDLMKKYSLKEEAGSILNTYDRALMYSQVSANGVHKMSFEDAAKNHALMMQEFAEDSSKWKVVPQDCNSINKVKYPEERSFCESMRLPEAGCEEITEQYVICNGARYVLDLKNNDGLSREAKKIEQYIQSDKAGASAAGVSK